MYPPKLITYWDLWGIPIAFLIIGFWAKRDYRKNYTGTITGKYYFKALWLRFFSIIVFSLIYTFYYRGGDAAGYFGNTKKLLDTLFTNPLLALDFFFNHGDSLSQPAREVASSTWHNLYLVQHSTLMVCRIGVLPGLIVGKSYIAISCFIGFFSFKGLLKLLSVFKHYFPNHEKQLSLAILFVPSILFWGSPLMKDSICIAAIGYFVYSVFILFEKRKLSLKHIIIALVCLYLLLIIKFYIGLILVPCVLLFVLFNYLKNIKSKIKKVIIFPIVLIVIVMGSVFSFQIVTTKIVNKSTEELFAQAEIQQKYLLQIAQRDEGSAYDLNISDYSMTGFIKAIPKCINVSLFRPYLWESRKPIMLLSAFESALALILFILVLFKKNIQIFTLTLNNPILLFSIVFTILFATIVGLTSGNFGTLVRYKIPCLPFFYAWLLIIFSHKKELVKNSNLKTDTTIQ